MNAAILNDTSHQTHFGCDLVMSTYDEQLKRVGVNVIQKIPNHQHRFSINPDTDLVIVNGEGTLHHGNGSHFLDAILRYPEVPFVLLNSVWESNPEYSFLSKFKYISVRESLSFKSLPPGLPNVEIVPDIIFSSELVKSTNKASPDEDIGVTDNVIKSPGSYDINSRASPNKVINEFLKYKRICTGRHHGVCLAAMLKKPFSAWPSNTHKILGMMEDMGIDHLHFNTKEEALLGIPENFDKKIHSYVEQATLSINNLFNRLASGNLY